MDKNLKKLSRVELLELMISLSEDYSALADENNRLKKMLAAQRLPRSTKVGSIAEAALQANNYFEAVQKSADEYLQEIKHLRDELARRADAQSLNQDLVNNVEAAKQANNKAQAELREAHVLASQVVARANSQAEAIVAEARTKAEQTLANANRESHALLSKAQQQANEFAQRSAATRQPVTSASSAFQQSSSHASPAEQQAAAQASLAQRLRLAQEVQIQEMHAARARAAETGGQVSRFQSSQLQQGGQEQREAAQEQRLMQQTERQLQEELLQSFRRKDQNPSAQAQRQRTPWQSGSVSNSGDFSLRRGRHNRTATEGRAQ